MNIYLDERILKKQKKTYKFDIPAITVEKEYLNKFWPLIRFKNKEFIPISPLKTKAFNVYATYPDIVCRPDRFEPNNNYNQVAYIPMAYIENKANVILNNVNLNDIYDIDYYRIKLDSGYTYQIKGKLIDNQGLIKRTKNPSKYLTYSISKYLWPKYETTDSFTIYPTNSLDYYFKVWSPYLNGTYTLQFSVERTPVTTSINKLQKSAIECKMDNENGMLQVQYGNFKEEIDKVLIYNTFGQQIKIIDKGKIIFPEFEINLAGCQPGAYFIQFRTNKNKIFAQKFFISK
jgi:hypothetical protein